MHITIEDVRQFEVKNVIASDSRKQKRLWCIVKNEHVYYSVEHFGKIVADQYRLVYAVEKYNQL